jgi:hypothetical protein
VKELTAAGRKIQLTAQLSGGRTTIVGYLKKYASGPIPQKQKKTLYYSVDARSHSSDRLEEI